MPSTSRWIGRSEVESSESWVKGNLEWIIDILPLVAFKNIAYFDGQEAVHHFLQRNIEYRKYLDFSAYHACLRMTYLLDFLNTHDPQKQSTVFKMLEKVDRGFKKLNAFQIIINREAAKKNDIFPFIEWNNLDYLLGWVEANVVPRLDAIPELIAVEALDVFSNKPRQLTYYNMFFKQHVSLEALCHRVEKGEKRELKALAKAHRKLKAEMDAKAGSRTHT
ncbi:hypothetical protein IL306_011069 [Fusarium sp. DS 682]|nr:hypothetical protein IL306_011069 [Fusarium sp. DS 682]